jgi:hypothetical protein
MRHFDLFDATTRTIRRRAWRQCIYRLYTEAHDPGHFLAIYSKLLFSIIAPERSFSRLQ